MTIIFEVIFEVIKKLYRFIGPAIFLVLILIIEIIAIPDVADSRASRDARHSEVNQVLSFEEIKAPEGSFDRVFKAVLRNTGADPNTLGMLYITNEDGKSIYNSIRTEYYDLRINGNVQIIEYIPPGSECTVYVYIDDYGLEGLDHIYVTDLYSPEKKGRGQRFEIEKK